ncbi:hypothetical protein IJT17_00125, partial [bacterium]|nr:hypothetical protein [bacterium]
MNDGDKFCGVCGVAAVVSAPDMQASASSQPDMITIKAPVAPGLGANTAPKMTSALSSDEPLKLQGAGSFGGGMAPKMTSALSSDEPLKLRGADSFGGGMAPKMTSALS